MPPPPASEPATATAPAPLSAIRYGMMAIVMALAWELKSWRNGDVVKWNGPGERKESFNRLRNYNNKRKIKLIECKVSTTIDYVVVGGGPRHVAPCESIDDHILCATHGMWQETNNVEVTRSVVGDMVAPSDPILG